MLEVEYGFLSLIPPIVAIVLALVTKQTVFSLVVGLWIGTTIICGWNPIVGFPTMISKFFIPLIANEWNAGMLMLIVSCGGFVYLIKRTGGAKAFGEFAAKRVKTRKQAQLTTYASAFAFIFTEPTLTLGSIMRPVTEKLRVSRVKLAYICDVMGCPFATLSPITSYSTYAIGLIATQFTALGITDNPWSVYLRALPFNFYATFGMLVLLAVIIWDLDIGPMYAAEQRAIKTGQLIGPNDNPMGKYDLDEDKLFSGVNLTLKNFLVPLGVLFLTLIAMIMWTGNAPVNGIGGAFVKSNISLSISTSFLTASIAAGIIGAHSKVFGFRDIVPEWCHGVALNSDIPVILVLAWSIGSLTGMMDLKGYLINIVESYHIPAGLMPAFLFVVGAFIGFSTGSSWGVWAIILPISLPVAHHFGVPMELMIGASLSGGVFGDHCSPISDTTILASTAAGADHVEHVKTQLPYSLTVAFCSGLGFLVGGLYSQMLGLVVAAVSLAFAVILLHRLAARRLCRQAA
ncbi:Na+/H+ antiporter family protein [Jonquetella anthropi E3_33 E1]|nr:Na+/H+ antiporter family protein [Jonquetella anthropi E3_33 E1]